MSKKNEDVTKQTTQEVVQEVAEEAAQAQSQQAEPTAEEKLELELKASKDQYMRLYAEYDNYRKRTQSEKVMIYSDATAKAVEEILPIADSVTMALASMADKDVPQEFTKGIDLIANQLKSSFDKLGVTSFGAVGDEFDPNIHNAISKIDSEELKENTIAQVYQTGYKIGDKIIRHAMVVVANCD